MDFAQIYLGPGGLGNKERRARVGRVKIRKDHDWPNLDKKGLRLVQSWWEMTKIGRFLLHFPIFLLEIFIIASQLSCDDTLLRTIMAGYIVAGNDTTVFTKIPQI